jgi:hypothetical protein
VIDPIELFKGVLNNVTNFGLVTRPSGLTVDAGKRKLCSKEEAEAKRMMAAKQKRVRAKKKEAVKQSEARHKACQQQIMQDAKSIYGLPSCS